MIPRARRRFFFGRPLAVGEDVIVPLLAARVRAARLGRRGWTVTGDIHTLAFVRVERGAGRGQVLWHGDPPPNWPALLAVAACDRRIGAAAGGKSRRDRN